MGTSWAKVTTHGDFAHTAYTDHALSAIDEMWLLWRELTEWIDEYKKRNVHMGVVPAVNRAALRGGLPWRAARTPNRCSLYVDIRYPPTRFPIDVEREFTAVVRKIAKDKLQRDVDIEYYMSRAGTQLPDNHAVIQAVVDAHRETTGQAVPAMFCVYWRMRSTLTDWYSDLRVRLAVAIAATLMVSISAPKKASSYSSTTWSAMHHRDPAAMNLNDIGLDKTVAMRGVMPSVAPGNPRVEAIQAAAKPLTRSPA